MLGRQSRGRGAYPTWRGRGTVNMRSLGLTAAIVALLVAACGQPQKLIGEPLPSAVAPNFTLLDGPTGELVTLSSLNGKAVLLTFLYTSCLDTCPLTAETLRNARDRLRDGA